MMFSFLFKASRAAVVAGCLCGAASLCASPALAEDTPLAADAKSIETCLATVTKNEAARGPHEEDELTEKLGVEGRLKAAQEAAPREKESCIGLVSTACLQEAGNTSTAAMSQCYSREIAVWDARLNAAYKKLLANGDGQDVADGFRKVQRAWIAYRDAACAQAGIVFKGTMAVPMSGYCMMDKTARQALWLEGWAQDK